MRLYTKTTESPRHLYYDYDYIYLLCLFFLLQSLYILLKKKKKKRHTIECMASRIQMKMASVEGVRMILLG